MEKTGFSIINNSYSLPTNIRKRQTNQVATNYPSSGVYPVYTQVPYGINKKGYFKIAESKLPTGEIAHIYKLINGQTVSVIQKPDGCPVVSTTFKVGSFDEPDGKEGISHLIEHSVFHESSKYPDVDEAIKAIGGYSNAGTSYSATRYYIKLSDDNRDNLEKAIDIEADMIFKPKFSKVDSKEKAIVIKEAKEGEHDEVSVAGEQSYKNLFSINKPGIKSLIGGSEDSINSITTDDMFNYHREFYIPTNCATVIVSPLNPDEVIEMASKKFLEATRNCESHAIKRRVYSETDTIKRNDFISKTSTQKKTLVSFSMPNMNLFDEIKMNAITRLLDSRASIRASFDRKYGNHSVLAFVNMKDDEYKFFENIKEAIEDIKQNPPNEYELKNLKKELASALTGVYSTNEKLAEVLPDDYLDNVIDTNSQMQFVENMTVNDILDAINKIDFSKASIEVIHPKGTTQKDLDEGLNSYRQYVSPKHLTRKTEKLNVQGNMESYNLYPYNNYQVQSTNLPNNTRFVVVDNPKDDSCRIKWELYNPDLKSFNPAAKFVLMDFTNILSIDDVNLQNEKGINVEYDYGNENKVAFNLTCKAEDINCAMEQLRKSMVMKFSEKEFKSLKQNMIDSIDIYAEDSIAFKDFLAEKLGANSICGKEQLLEYLNKLTYDDVKSYYNALMNSSYSTVCAEIPFNANRELINTVASGVSTPNFSFRKEDEGKYAKVYKADKPKYYPKENNQPQYMLAYSFKTNGNKSDSIKFDILTSVLNQRIYNILREEQQLCYQAGAICAEYGDMGVIRPYITTDHTDKETVAKIYKIFNEQIKRISQEPITSKELQEAKSSMKRECYDLGESKYNSDSKDWDICDEINYALKTPYGLNQMQNNLQMIESTTPEDILKTAQYVFKDKPSILVEADKNTLEGNDEFFRSLI